MAENVVETILVKLGLDGSAYNQNAEKAISTNKKLNSSVSETDKVVGSVTKTLGRFFSVLAVGTGVVKLINEVQKLNNELFFLEKNLGMSAQSVKAWQGAAGAMGGSAQGMTSSMQGLTKSITDFQMRGDTSMLPTMNALGVSMVDATGKARQTNDVMLDLADSFSKMDRQQALSLSQDLGMDEGTFNTLVQGRKEMEKMIEYQKTMYQSSEAELQVSRDLAKNRALLGQHWESMKTMMGNILMPLFLKASEVLLGMFEWLQKNQKAVQAVFTGIAFVVGAVMTPILVKATIALLAFIAPFAPFILVVGALGAAFGLLYDDYKTWAEGGKSLFDWGAFRDYIDNATLSTDNLKNAFKNLASDVMSSVIPTLKGYADIIRMLSDGDFKGAGSLALEMGKQYYKNIAGVVDDITGQEQGTLWNAGKNLLGMGGGSGSTASGAPVGSNSMLDLIAKGEVGTTGKEGYNVAYRGSRVSAKGMFGKDLSQLTIGQVKELQKASLKEQASRGIPASKRSSAMGRYQFINTGFDDYINAAGLSDKSMFSPENQDAMAMAILSKGKYGLNAVKAGTATPEQFQNNVLASRWASIKMTNGRGKYDNDGINKASHGNTQEILRSINQVTNRPAPQAQANKTSNVKNDVNVGGIKVYTSASTITGVASDAGNAIGNSAGMLMLSVQ